MNVRNKYLQTRKTTGFSAGMNRLKQASSMEKAPLFLLLKTKDEGLDAETVLNRQEQMGRNEVGHEKEETWFIQLLHAFINPFIGILVFIAIISAIIDIWLPVESEEDYSTIIVVCVMVLISVTLRFVQEFRSSNAARRLKEMVSNTATVLRNGVKTETDISDIVPGDLIILSAGDMVPADCRILQAKDLFIVQSALTGESLPVEKKEGTANAADIAQTPVLELPNICFMGTNVISGTATAVSVATADSTYFGSLGKSAVGKRAETNFDVGLKKVSYLLITFMAIMVPVVFLINGWVKGDWIDALLFAVAIAVGLTPEMLPMIVTANLAKGAVNMSRHKVIIKRLGAIQNIGAMDMLCTDKTGTLTLDKVVLERHLNLYGETDEEVLQWTYLNSYYQTGLKSLLDVAVLEHAELHDRLQVEQAFIKVDELPFDFQRRCMSVILERQDGSHLLICKGAVEEMLHLCNRAFDPGEDRQLQIDSDHAVTIDNDVRRHILDMSRKLNEEGLRVLIVAVRSFPSDKTIYSNDDENHLTMAGFICFLDPAKPTAASAIHALQDLGVQVKVLTGDNEIVTRKICHDTGIPYEQVLLGRDLETMDDTTLQSRIREVSLFAKLSPMQKERIVQTLRQMGHTVGFMGDGINDAAALKAADVGISVDTAVDIAKENADIILLEKDLTVLRSGVIYGRRTFGNIIKYIKMTTSSNFGNMLSMLGASLFLPFLPMLPIQILVQNLLYDFSQTSIPWDRMDREFIERPKVWDASGLRRFMLTMGPVSSLFDYLTFALLFFIFGASDPAHQSLFQTGWFVEGLLTQTFIVHVIRTRRLPFIESRAARPVLLMTLFVMFLGILLPFTPIASALKMTPLPASYFPCLIVILLLYSLLAQWVKHLFVRRFGQWL